jgi:penicillin-binding protein-related factor A (putative recombinase)
MGTISRAELDGLLKRRAAGRAAQKIGQSFEARVKLSCDVYREQEIAFLFPMPVPTAPCGVRGKGGAPLRVLSGQAPFDFFGWTRDGHAVGLEVKATARKKSLPIIGEGKCGSGLQWHQLEALADLYLHGGEAVLLWKNGDDVGLVSGFALYEARQWYRRDGRKSIPWHRFRPVPMVFHGPAIAEYPDWWRGCA